MTTSLIQFHKTDNVCHYELTQEGKKCQFLQFLINTSNFLWHNIFREKTGGSFTTRCSAIFRRCSFFSV